MEPRLTFVEGTANVRSRLDRENTSSKLGKMSKATQERLRQIDTLLAQAEQMIAKAQSMLADIAEHGP
jgi:hypothetical protein